MSVIYEPRGKAKEYSPLALNIYSGCAHGCIYCYAPNVLKLTKDVFSSPKPRKNILSLIEKDVRKIKNDSRQILLCFTCDPYQPIDEKLKLTRQAIRLLTENNCSIQILTKGGLRATRDFDLLSKNPNNSFAATLTHDNEHVSKIWEPNASPPSERIQSLKIAHEKNIKTWVSFEPVINPSAVYRLINQTHLFIDLYKIGKLNYHPRANQIDWPKFRTKVIKQLNELDKPYYIKKDLLFAK